MNVMFDRFWRITDYTSAQDITTFAVECYVQNLIDQCKIQNPIESTLVGSTEGDSQDTTYIIYC